MYSYYIRLSYHATGMVSLTYASDHYFPDRPRGSSNVPLGIAFLNLPMTSRFLFPILQQSVLFPLQAFLPFLHLQKLAKPSSGITSQRTVSWPAIV